MPAAPAPVTAYVEVTNTLVVPYVTGIQRTVRQVLAHWPDPSACGVDVVPVVRTGRLCRRLHPHEAAALSGPPQPAPAGPGGGGLDWRAAARQVPGLGAARDRLRDLQHARRDRRDAAAGLAVEPAAGDVWFDLEATWWSPDDRARLLPALHGAGVATATLVYDLMPLSDPDWFDPDNRAAFVPWARAQLRHVDLAICFSRFCAAEVARVGGALDDGAEGPGAPPTALFTPGADGASAGGEGERPAAVPDDGRPFAVAVGTIEPRKNVEVLLDAFEVLWRDGHDGRLVLVGRRGWEVDALVARLRTHPERGRRLVWMDGAGDAEVDWLYRHAAAVAVPSRCEGYGLPVVEGLRRGAPVVSSTGGALPEVGGDVVTYADPDDVAAWAAALGAHLDDPVPPGDRVPADVPAVRATWADAAATIAGHLRALADGELGRRR